MKEKDSRKVDRKKVAAWIQGANVQPALSFPESVRPFYANSIVFWSNGRRLCSNMRNAHTVP